MNPASISKLPRRTFLKGAGATLALPFLEAAQPKSATLKPTRMAFFYVPNGMAQKAWHPEQTGKNFALSPSLQPLEKIRQKITLHTNLDRIKVPGTDGHAQASSCYLSSATPDELSPAGYPLKRTIDQVIADEAGKHTAFRSLELSCNSYKDNRESVYFDNISWFGHGHVARSMKDPQKVFRRLFAVDEHKANASVLDVILADAKDLQPKLGRLDRDKLGEYLESVRMVEQQIERISKRQDDLEELNLIEPDKLWTAMTRDEYVQVMGDLMILALQTDLTRVATLMVAPERWDTPLAFHGVFDKPIRHHGWTHNQHKQEVLRDLEKLDLFHVEQFAQLATKMDAIKEGEGTLLDNVMFTMGSGLSSGMLHECTNLPTVVAGLGGGSISANQHIKHPKGTPIANLWLSMAKVMGASKTRLGDSTGTLTNWLT
jgi:hypothetical protein